MKKILLLAVNPKGTSQLRLDEEVREVEEAIRRANRREQFEIATRWAVRVSDLRRALLDHRPAILHFSGHGAGDDGLVLENDAGQVQLVGTESLTRLFEPFQTQIECVLLNACYSEVQANAIHRYIDCVIGMNRPIGDRAAIAFSTGFYDALGAGMSYPDCFDIGRSAIDLGGIPESEIPVIKARKRASQPAATGPSSQSEMEQKSPVPPSNKSQTVGNISSSGSGNNVVVTQADGDVNLDQSRTQVKNDNPQLQTALAALEELKQQIAVTNALNSIQKKQAELPVEMLEDELKKPQPDKSLVDEAVQALKQGLEGVETLAPSVMKVASLLAGIWV